MENNPRKRTTVEMGKFLQQKRLDNELSQSQLAKKLHYDRSTVSKWETGDSFPSNVNVLKNLAEIYNEPPSKFITQMLAML